MQIVLRKDNTAVLVTLAIILRVIYLLLISELKVNPAEVYYIWPRVPEPLR